jgi:hypothetical protein
MPEPRLTILGVYRPQISEESWQEQWQVTADDAYTQEYFDQLVLIEGIVEGLGDPFDMGKFGQMSREAPDDPDQMLVGYDEGLLSADGEELIERKMDCIHGTGPLRFAVYLQYYDPTRPLQWQNGFVDCPTVQQAPERLTQLMPYTAQD